MNAQNKILLQAELSKVAVLYPQVKISKRGLLRAVTAWGDFCPVILPDVFDWQDVSADDLQEMPVALEDPLSALVATRLFTFDDDPEAIPAVGSWGDLRAQRFLPEGYMRLRRACLDEALALLTHCGRPHHDGSVQKRVRYYRQILWAQKWDGPDPIKTAQDDLETAERLQKP